MRLTEITHTYNIEGIDEERHNQVRQRQIQDENVAACSQCLETGECFHRLTLRSP
jgi:hypothetical protein